MSRRTVFALLAGIFVIVFAPSAPAVESEQDKWQKMVGQSIDYLRVRGQANDGSFSKASGIGPTGLVTTALLTAGVPSQDPLVAKALDYLEKHVRDDGGIYALDSLHRNYDTCITMVALAKANDPSRFGKIIARAEAFVRGNQLDEDEGRDLSNLDYGGAGYGKHKRPDLSNTSYLIDALRELGNGPEDESIQKALAFVTRCQNLESVANSSPHAAKVDDGGFYYTVAAGGESKAGTEPNGGLRSYGSMTYAGLKSMIYAGLDKDDERVAAAVDFLSKHYDLESNPGMGQQGLFYYYHTMAKALSALGEEEFKDSDGKLHDWKAELRSKLHAIQLEDGSWVNPTTRWMEGDPNLVSAYALMALSYCKP